MYVGYQASTSVGASSPYIFTTKYLTNNNISYAASTGIFTFREPGWYEIDFDTAAAAASGNVTPTLYLNGVASTHELTQFTSSAVTDFASGSFSAVIHVVPTATNTYSTAQIINTGIAATTLVSNIIIKRIG